MTIASAPAVPLKDVEWRLDSEPKEGRQGTRARFVPHINARIAAALMDEWVGPLCWTDEYRTVTIAAKEAILCTVSVWDGERWVSKQDVGVPSHTEAQKGGISDAFKRTVTVKWGAGRNVYDLPTLWAPCKSVNSNGKVRGYANDETLPDLLRQLKGLGFDATGCRLEDGAKEDLHASNENAGLGAIETSSSATASSPGPATSPARRQKLKSRCSALLAEGVPVAEAREVAGLPIVDSCSELELTHFEEIVDALEAQLEKPFVEASK